MSEIMMPPLLKGSQEARLEALRGYLFLLAEEVNRLSQDMEALSFGEKTVAGKRVYTKGENSTGGEELTERLNSLRSLIKQTAHTVSREMDLKVENLNETLVAKSDFGQYKEEINTQIQTTARSITESYGYTGQIEALMGAGDETAAMLRQLNGQIKRGILTDPDTGEQVFGIAIGSELLVTGERVSREGKSYDVLSPGQTLGLYTDKGWQFWINGISCGGFSSADSAIHADKMSLSGEMTIGSWQVKETEGGLGVKYL